MLFTSGATGPAKGVVYTHRQAAAQLEVVRSAYALTADDRFVAAFAPFAILGPALGIGSAVPDVDVTAPGSLTAAALADAAAAVDATVVFASPAALRRVAATAEDLSAPQRAALAGIRLLMSAGAPVPASLLRSLRPVLPAAGAHTPYGMTEVLPVTDISLAGIEAAGTGEGVCVGRPLPGVGVRISPLFAGRAVRRRTDRPSRALPVRSACRPRTSRTATTRCGRSRSRRRATPVGTGPVTSGTWTPRAGSGSRDGCNTSSPRPPVP